MKPRTRVQRKIVDRLAKYYRSQHDDSYFGQNLVNAVESGQVSQDRIDVSSPPYLEITLTKWLQDMATRILASWYLLGQDSGFPAVNFNSWTPSEGQHINVSADHATYGVFTYHSGFILIISAAASSVLSEQRRLCCSKIPTACYL